MSKIKDIILGILVFIGYGLFYLITFAICLTPLYILLNVLIKSSFIRIIVASIYWFLNLPFYPIILIIGAFIVFNTARDLFWIYLITGIIATFGNFFIGLLAILFAKVRSLFKH